VGVHESANPETDPNDAVYGCENTCFGDPENLLTRPSSITCAACVGVRNGDTEHCGGYPYLTCPAKTWCWCPISLDYGTEDNCAMKCPSGLDCFAAQCHSAESSGACR
jgi:hypothetical protein